MALPKEPRQKMINMMYLVLTALLALNVSSEILNAFKTVNNSLESSNATVSLSTQSIMTSLEEKRTKPETAERANIWHPKAQQAQQESKSLYDYIDQLKKSIMSAAKYDPASGKEKGVDNLDAATRIMVEKGEGKNLYKRLQDFQNNILNLDPKIKEHFGNSLPIDLKMPKTQNKSNNTWEAAYFRMVPTVAALTILSKFQNDVKTTENKVVTFCHEQVGKVDVPFDTYAAVVGQSSTYLMPGQELEISAGVGAYSKAAKPIITIGGSNVALGEDGAAHWKTTANTVGSHRVPVKVTFTDQNGKIQTIDKVIEYTVGQANAAVALDKMNVLFIGVDNEITISASGGSEKIRASISQGTITGSGGKYKARVNNIDDNCIISVTIDNKTTQHRFRVRTIPDPTPMVGQRKSGEVPAAEFKSQAGVRAILENFYYETQFNVTSFRITGDGAGFDEGIIEANNTGAAWNEARKIIDRCRPGSFITIEEIRAVGPDGRTRRLTPLIFNLR